MTKVLAGVLLMACLAAACDESVVGPTTPLDREFTLAPGERVAVEGVGLSLRFDGVTGDSRCPSDVVCIQGGSADVHLTAFVDRGSQALVIRTGDMQPATVNGLTVRLVQLSPYPFSTRTIAPQEYRATLRVTR